jgi:hypothetical protein
MGPYKDAVLDFHAMVDGDIVLDFDVIPNLDAKIHVDALTEDAVASDLGILANL